MGTIGTKIGAAVVPGLERLPGMEQQIGEVRSLTEAVADAMGRVEAGAADTQAVVVDSRHAIQDVRSAIAAADTRAADTQAVVIDSREAVHDVQTSLAHARGALDELRRVVDETRALVADVVVRPDNSPLTILRQVLQRVERYQPIYGLTDNESVQRLSHDRASLIEDALGDLRGLRLLDLGSSLGYFPMYAADRGATAEGWDFKGDNVTVARLAATITGSTATFHERTIDLENIRRIEPGRYDVVLCLSVLHHVIALHGVAYVQELVRELVERVPVLVLELAAKGEDPSLTWDASQPDDPREVLALVSDLVEVTPLGTFGTHLSEASRPLILVRRAHSVRVGPMVVAAKELLTEPYDNAPIGAARATRRYFLGDDVVVKQYLLGPGSDANWRQVVAELYALTVVLPGKEVFRAPELVAHELHDDHAKLALRRVPGILLEEVSPLSRAEVEQVARDLLRTLDGLHSQGLRHNDVRSWNILVNDEGGWLIDYGLAAPVSHDDDVHGLLWALHAGLTGQREAPSGSGISELPPSAPFGKGALASLWTAVAEGQTDAGELLRAMSS